MKKFLIATVAAIAISGAASAADMSMPTKARPAPAPVYSWTGCYLDAGGGYGMWNQSQYMSDPATGQVFTSEQTIGGRGYYGEVGGGCDYQISLGGVGNFVAGALGGYDFMSLKGAYVDPFGAGTAYEKETGSWMAGGRFGYLITPTFLTYLSGGYTQARFSPVTPVNTPGAPIGRNLLGHTYNGYFVGGGAETSLSPWLPPGFFLRTDYRVSTYRAADLQYLDNAGAPTVFSTHVNKYSQQIGTELIYRFNYHPAVGVPGAADVSMPVKARPMSSPAYNWTGCYLDAGGGYGMWNQTHTESIIGLGPFDRERTAGGRGYYGTAGGGCDYQFPVGGLGNFVVGALGGYDFMSLKGATTSPVIPATAPEYETEKGAWDIGGRLGYLVTPNFLTYFSGGYTSARFSAIISPSGVGVVALPSHTYNGYFFGGGAETSLSPWLPIGFFLRSDYKVSTYRPADLVYTLDGAPLAFSTHINNYVQQIGTELIYRFNYH
jgi:outer membrane immunogenic protein